MKILTSRFKFSSQKTIQFCLGNYNYGFRRLFVCKKIF